MGQKQQKEKTEGIAGLCLQAVSQAPQHFGPDLPRCKPFTTPLKLLNISDLPRRKSFVHASLPPLHVIDGVLCLTLCSLV